MCSQKSLRLMGVPLFRMGHMMALVAAEEHNLQGDNMCVDISLSLFSKKI